jgi:hypothetical protein
MNRLDRDQFAIDQFADFHATTVRLELQLVTGGQRHFLVLADRHFVEIPETSGPAAFGG